MMTPLQIADEMNRMIGRRSPYPMAWSSVPGPVWFGAKRQSKHAAGRTPAKPDRKAEKRQRKAAAKSRAYNRRKGC